MSKRFLAEQKVLLLGSNGWDPRRQFIDHGTSARVVYRALLFNVFHLGVCQCATTLAYCFVIVNISIQSAPAIVTTIADSDRRRDSYRGNWHSFFATRVADHATTGPAIMFVPSCLRLGIGCAIPGKKRSAASTCAILGKPHPL